MRSLRYDPREPMTLGKRREGTSHFRRLVQVAAKVEFDTAEMGRPVRRRDDAVLASLREGRR
jgi:hypothetical protein